MMRIRFVPSAGFVGAILLKNAGEKGETADRWRAKLAD
jgi:hypothetical protein